MRKEMDITAEGPTGQDSFYSVADDDDDKDKRAILYKFETKRCSFGCHETSRGNASTCFFH